MRMTDSELTIHGITAGTAPRRRGPRVFPDSSYSTAQTISLPAWERLQRAPGEARVLGRFQRVVDLQLGDDLVALATLDVGCGPFHLVLDALPVTPLPERVALRMRPDVMHVGPWRIAFPAALPLWNPRPAWEQLVIIPARLAMLRDVVGKAARAGNVSPLAQALHIKNLCGLAALRKVSPTPPTLDAAVVALAGWGPGLTPSGDDFLAGLMLALWAQQGEAARPLCEGIVAVAAPRTTRLSGAFLRAAAEGLADERWHALLHALAGDSDAAVAAAAQAVLAFGASSGLDMLVGFLWKG